MNDLILVESKTARQQVRFMYLAGRRWRWRPEKRRHLVVLAWVVGSLAAAIPMLYLAKGVIR